MAGPVARTDPQPPDVAGTSGPDVRLLLEPSDGLSDLVDSPDALDRAIAAMGSGAGPIAVDAERASGYRYSQRAHLIQLRRAGSGTVLLDPIALPELGGLAEVMRPHEWVLHAASQDLPCLAELGLIPERLFDSELAGRLLGYERVGLGTLVETILRLRLEKGHSAADWSRRPLPEAWLVYAALDVEVLVELRDHLEDELVAAGKDEWARQEFAHVLAQGVRPPVVREEPWRRTSGIHLTRDRRQLAVVRALWLQRDEAARRRDLAPAKLLADAAIVEAAARAPATRHDLGQLRGFTGRRGGRADLGRWWAVLEQTRALPEDELPLVAARGDDGPPPPRTWERQRPEAAIRLKRCRAAVLALATTLQLPPENLVGPDLVRRLAWTPPEPSPTAVAARLADGGARPWQVDLVAAPLAGALPG